MTIARGWQPAVALVVPAYNEAGALCAVLARCLAATPRVVVVDDGSTDTTWEIIRRYPVTAFRHAANRGKAAALLSGVMIALQDGADFVATIDADGQHRPEDLARLVEAAALSPGAIVIGSRRADRAGAPPARYRANRIADFWISWAAGQAIDDSQSGFRLYPAAVLRRLLAMSARSCGFVFESEILINAGRAGVPILAVPIPALYGGTTLRASHFKPVGDIAKIALMVGWKLLSWGMYPTGLRRSLQARRRVGPGRTHDDLSPTRTIDGAPPHASCGAGRRPRRHGGLPVRRGL